MNTAVKIGSQTVLKNPVTLASGTAGYGEELSKFYDLSKIGAIFTKGLSLNPRPGNEGNRILETNSGILNSIGLENVGLDKFLEEKLAFLLEKNIKFIPNVAGHSEDENIELCEKLSQIDNITAIELNVSCPNVKEGGLAFGQNIKSLEKLLLKVRPVTKCDLIVKLSPNVTDIAEFAICAENCGADAVSAVNTFLGMKIDIKNKKPHFDNTFAGLSGPAIKPAALRCVYQIASSVKIPVIGLGGIKSAEDAIEFLMAGATAVSIGTMNLVYPDIGETISIGISEFLSKNNYTDVNEIIGIANN